MAAENTKPVLGVIGGMGPFASAQFVLTIYNRSNVATEQHMPEVHLYSRPGIADRSRSIQEGSFDCFTESLISLLRSVEGSCDRMLICCFTSHNAWHHIPVHIRAKLVNLVDYTINLVRQQDERVLLIATEGSYTGGIFLKDKPDNLVLLEDKDISDIHALIYDELKRGRSYKMVYEKLQQYREKYGCTKILAGCTELHLLKTAIAGDDTILDPLYEIAGNIHKLMPERSLQTV